MKKIKWFFKKLFSNHIGIKGFIFKVYTNHVEIDHLVEYFNKLFDIKSINQQKYFKIKEYKLINNKNKTLITFSYSGVNFIMKARKFKKFLKYEIIEFLELGV